MKLKTILAVLGLIAGTFAVAPFAQGYQAPDASQAGAQQTPAKLDSESSIGELLDDPRTKPVITKHFKNLVESERLEMARNMSLRSMQGFAPDMFTDAKLAEFDAELAKVQADPAKK